jgi:hypothetical protein
MKLRVLVIWFVSQALEFASLNRKWHLLPLRPTRGAKLQMMINAQTMQRL